MLNENECRTKLKELRSLTDRKTELNNQKTEVQKQIDTVNAEVTEYFEINEIQNMRLVGYGMFYVKRTEFPQIQNPDAVKAWLKERGDLDMLMSFNTNKFKAYWKEQNAEGIVMPDVNTFIKTEVGMRKGDSTQ